jgi:hypothetical protein
VAFASGQDRAIAGAPAQVARQNIAHRKLAPTAPIARPWSDITKPGVQNPHCDAPLDAIVLLQRGELVAQPVNRQQGLAVKHRQELDAGIDRAPVQPFLAASGVPTSTVQARNRPRRSLPSCRSCRPFAQVIEHGIAGRDTIQFHQLTITDKTHGHAQLPR